MVLSLIDWPTFTIQFIATILWTANRTRRNRKTSPECKVSKKNTLSYILYPIPISFEVKSGSSLSCYCRLRSNTATVAAAAAKHFLSAR